MLTCVVTGAARLTAIPPSQVRLAEGVDNIASRGDAVAREKNLAIIFKPDDGLPGQIKRASTGCYTRGLIRRCIARKRPSCGSADKLYVRSSGHHLQ